MFPPTQEPPYLMDEQCFLVALSQPKTASHAGYSADKLVKVKKRKVAQEQQELVRFGEEYLTNSSYLEYLGVMQSSAGDPLHSL